MLDQEAVLDEHLGRPTPEDDYQMLVLLSVGLLLIRESCQDSHTGERLDDPQIGLLPGPWRIGMARLWWRCHEQGATPPESDIQLFAWCRLPFSDWPIDLTLSPLDRHASLIDETDQLTDFTEQAGRLIHVSDLDAELTENRINADLRTVAVLNADGDDILARENYVLLRRLIMDHTVLTDHEVRRLARKFKTAGPSGQPAIIDLINLAYHRRNVADAAALWRCTRCENLLEHDGASCRTPGCRGGSESFTVEAQAHYFTLHRAARRFIHDPGLVEKRVHDELAAQLSDLPVRLTQYPLNDRLDLLIEFLQDGPSGPEVVETWGADAKDHTSPRLLGRGFRWPKDLPCEGGRFLVLPMHRFRRRGYVGELKTELSGRTNVTAISEDAFCKAVIARAKGLASQ